MIAADTSTWIAFLQEGAGQDADQEARRQKAPGQESPRKDRSSEDTSLLDRALSDQQVVMVPAVLTELLSDPKLAAGVAKALADVPLLDLDPGYWQRAGLLRARVLSRRREARLGDALIAQTCIDHAVPLITRDDDFRAFAAAAGLDLVLGFRSAKPSH